MCVKRSTICVVRTSFEVTEAHCADEPFTQSTDQPAKLLKPYAELIGQSSELGMRNIAVIASFV